MPQIPDQIRPYVAVLAKYHFWILAALVPLVLLPLLFMGTGKIDKEIAGRKQEIDGRVSSLAGVKGIAPHPNERWAEAVDAQTQKIRAETLAEWKRFWQDQAALREWPKRLGDDFIKAITSLKPGGSLNRQMLLRYQNLVPELVRTLPARMGADDLMVEGATQAGPGPEGMPGFRGPLAGPPGGDFGPRPGMGGPPAAAAGGSRALVQWAQTDQARLLDSFRFDTKEKRCGKDVITTAQVLLAQEELWVYGVLCDVIRKLNAGADGPFSAPIGSVLEIAVGYPAAEEQVGGQNAARILLPSASGVPGGEMGGNPMPPDMGAAVDMPGMGGGAPAARPPHPRFGTASSGLGRGPMAGEFGGEGMVDPSAAPTAPEDQLREWIYVDFTGKPLTAAELATAPAAQMMHLMPFVMRLAMDQRTLDALLVELATNPLPIDVRQVRVNPSQQTGGGPGQGGFADQPSFAAAEGFGGSIGRPHDVVVELRGTVGLATPPDARVLGGSEQAAAGGGP